MSRLLVVVPPPMPRLTMLHVDPLESTITCCPVLAPQMIGVPLPAEPVMLKVSVKQSPDSVPVFATSKVLAAAWVPTFEAGPAKVNVVKSKRMRQTSVLQGQIVNLDDVAVEV